MTVMSCEKVVGIASEVTSRGMADSVILLCCCSLETAIYASANMSAISL